MYFAMLEIKMGKGKLLYVSTVKSFEGHSTKSIGLIIVQVYRNTACDYLYLLHISR